MAKQTQSSGPSGPSTASRVGKQIGTYRLETLLASGGMGEIYAIEQTNKARPAQHRPYVAKILSETALERPKAVERLKREIRIHQTLAHSGIVMLMHHGEDDALGPFLIMEKLHGQTLKTYMSANKQPAPMDKVTRWVGQVCEALGWLHEQGLYHRDIKPANLFLDMPETSHGQVKLIDFGIAYSADEPDTPGEQMGTPRYMAPEQIQCQEVGPSTDLYAFGGVMYEVLTRRIMHPERDSKALKQAQLERPAPTLSQARPDLLFAPALEELMQSLLAKDPTARPSTAAEVAERFTSILTETPVEKKAGKLGIVLGDNAQQDLEADDPTPAPDAPSPPDVAELDLDFAEPDFFEESDFRPDDPSLESQPTSSPIVAILLLLVLAVGMCAGVVWWLFS